MGIIRKLLENIYYVENIEINQTIKTTTILAGLDFDFEKKVDIPAGIYKIIANDTRDGLEENVIIMDTLDNSNLFSVSRKLLTVKSKKVVI